MEWTGGIPLGVLLALLSKPRSHSFTQKTWLFTAPALILLVGYFFFPGSGTLQYDPRYLYEFFGLLLIPAASNYSSGNDGHLGYWLSFFVST
jgi:hypothetical protein